MNTTHDSWQDEFRVTFKNCLFPKLIESFIEQLLLSKAEELKAEIERRKGKWPILSASASVCHICGFRNDHGECMCRENAQLSAVQDLVNQIMK